LLVWLENWPVKPLFREVFCIQAVDFSAAIRQITIVFLKFYYWCKFIFKTEAYRVCCMIMTWGWRLFWRRAQRAVNAATMLMYDFIQKIYTE
jgi:hypothetical protein